MQHLKEKFGLILELGLAFADAHNVVSEVYTTFTTLGRRRKLPIQDRSKICKTFSQNRLAIKRPELPIKDLKIKISLKNSDTRPEFFFAARCF